MSNVIDFAKHKREKDEGIQPVTYSIDNLDTMQYTISLNDVEYEIKINEDTVIISPEEMPDKH